MKEGAEGWHYTIVSYSQVQSKQTHDTYLFRDEGRRYAAVMIDLKNASRDDLIRLIVSQHETITRQERVIAAQQARIVVLEATVAELTVRVGELLAALAAIRDETASGIGRPQGMPGLKPVPGKTRPPKSPRKGREQHFVRHRMEPTVRVIHALDACPTCGLPLSGGSV